MSNNTGFSFFYFFLKKKTLKKVHFNFIHITIKSIVKKSMRREAVMGAVRGVAALGVFVLDSFRTFDFDLLSATFYF